MILAKFSDGTFFMFQPFAFIDAVKDELSYMFQNHAEEVNAILPYNIDPDWDAMKEMQGGFFLLVKDNKIVGYSGVSFGRDLHRKGIKTATVHSIFVVPECRGITSYRFVVEIIKHLRKEPVHYISFGISPAKDFSKILKRLGAIERHVDYVFIN